MEVLCFGEILYDNIEEQSYLGGAPLNFAAHMAKLGAQSFILSRVGEDKLGTRSIGKAEEWGIETKFIQQDDSHHTGEVKVALREGSPSYKFLEDTAYDYIDFEEFILNYTIEEFDLLYFGTLAQRNEQSRSTLWRLIEDIDFPNIFFDVNLREDYFTTEIIHVSLHKATIFKLNDEEVAIISELLYEREMEVREFCETLANDYSLRLIVVTRGGEGCSVFENQKFHEFPGVKVEVKDTVGAGDAFSAAFMYYYLSGATVEKAAEKANKLGAFVASSAGAVPEYSQELLAELR